MKNRRIIVASLPLTLALTMAVPPLAFATPKPPNEESLKYADAAKALKDAGFTVRVASKIGDRTALDECTVVHQHLRGEAQSTKKKVDPKTVLISLSCYGGTASHTSPGDSAGTPAARARAAAAAAAAKTPH